MSKNALGSRPSFNNVAKATGDLALDIDFNNDLEEKASNPLLEDADNEEEAKRKFKEQRQEEIIKEQREELKHLEELEREKVIEEVQEQRANKEEKKEKPKKESKTEEDKPTTKKHLAEGYTRATFAIRDDHLELIKAIASYKGIEQKVLLEAILEDALGKIKDQVKEEALATYKQKENKGKLRDIFK